jgi:predicted membrane protein
MTIQVAVMNGYGLAMASDRHVFRGPDARSTGQDVKLLALRGSVPGAMMAAGPFAVFGLPVSRLSLRLERALAAASEEGPDALAEAALAALRAPLAGAPAQDEELLAEVAEQVLARAAEDGRGLEQVLEEIAAAPACRDAEAFAARFDGAWARALPVLADRPRLQAALREAPALCGRAVAEALAHDWHHSELFLTVGLCCPATGVPVLLALRLWRGIGGHLHAASRLAGDWEAAWRAGRTVVMAQGSGRKRVEAMIDGITDGHWTALPGAAQDSLRAGMDRRWDKAHGRLAVSSPRELAALAMGLVRGAEVIGYLTGEDEGSIAGVDGLVITPRGVEACALAA